MEDYNQDCQNKAEEVREELIAIKKEQQES